MIVNNNFKYKTYFFLVLIVFSCQKKDERKLIKENTFQIVSFLMDSLVDGSVNLPNFPPPPNEKNYIFSIKDSLRNYKHFYTETIRQKKVAVKPTFFSLKKDKISFNNNCKIDITELLSDSSMLNSSLDSIDIKKLTLRSKSIIIPYNDVFKNDIGKGFSRVDLIFNFSKIIYNKNFNKAIIIVGVSTGKLSGFSTLIYLEKENYHWVIKCEKNLSIS